MIALIDGDEFAHKTCYACTARYYSILSDGREIASIETKKEADAYCEGMAGNLEIVLQQDPKSFGEHLNYFHAEINRVVELCAADDARIYFSDVYNFRTDIATICPYKGNRDGNEKPKYYHGLIDDVIASGGIRWRGAEADDALSYNQTTDTVIVSQDKDLDMVPGLRLRKDGSIREICESAGRGSFYRQLLTGDPSDNIPGIFGIGTVKAADLIDDGMTEQEQFTLVVREYNKAMRDQRNKFFGRGMTPNEIILEIGRLLWLQRPDKLLWRSPYAGY